MNRKVPWGCIIVMGFVLCCHICLFIMLCVVVPKFHDIYAVLGDALPETTIFLLTNSSWIWVTLLSPILLTIVMYRMHKKKKDDALMRFNILVVMVYLILSSCITLVLFLPLVGTSHLIMQGLGMRVSYG